MEAEGVLGPEVGEGNMAVLVALAGEVGDTEISFGGCEKGVPSKTDCFLAWGCFEDRGSVSERARGEVIFGDVRAIRKVSSRTGQERDKNKTRTQGMCINRK